MQAERIYQLALTRLPFIGHVHAKILVERFGNATNVFKASRRDLEAIPGIGESRARAVAGFSDFGACEKTCLQAEALGIQFLFIGEQGYPHRLQRCFDPPTLLYYKGEADLNARKMVALIGTRMHTEYARQQTEKFIRELAAHQVTIVSGMAFGIDGLAHRYSLQNGLPTIGVLAHGLDSVYPPQHRDLARDMLLQGGGLLTEFPLGEKADRHHFPIRNRIVAGLCDAVVIMETAIRGGSMITAGLADGYGTALFAFPGRATDRQSSGCNLLIRQKKAGLVSSARELLDELNWMGPAEQNQPAAHQASIPFDLDPAESIIVHLLGLHGTLPIDRLYLLSGLASGTAATAILGLELKNIITTLPGKRYRLRGGV